MSNMYIHKINYIYWRNEATQIKCTFEQFHNIYLRLKETGTKVKYSTKREVYENLCYSIRTTDKSNNKAIYVYENGKYYIYYTNKLDDSKNERTKSYGLDGIRFVQEHFEEDNQTGFKKAFGYVEEEFKRCVPKVFSYSKYNKEHICPKPFRTSSVDFSSHWPFNAQGQLPDAHTAVRYEGRVEPNEEYPFAFYLNSGHIAEYGVFDSHNWVNSSLCDAIFRYGKKEIFPQKPFLEDNEEITVLMKKSSYTLGKYYKMLYDMRKDNPDAKLMANASLGFMHKKNYDRYKMAHIVAVVLGRAQDKTINLIKDIGEMFVVHACVDGVIYKLNIPFGEEEKSFGGLHQEWINKYTYIIATNCYIVLDDDRNCIKVKHGSYQCRIDGSEITEENVKSFDDYKNWIAKWRPDEDED